MPRVKRGTVRAAKRKKLLKRAKGYFRTKSKLYQAAQEAVAKADNYAFSGRRRKKRDFRSLWVVRVNAAARKNGLAIPWGSMWGDASDGDMERLADQHRWTIPQISGRYFALACACALAVFAVCVLRAAQRKRELEA